jgi:23S rRNA pseudouridine2605 synthase
MPRASRPRPNKTRLQKIVAAAGVASRRGAEDLLREGRVAVNGVRARLGDSADAQCDVVTVDGVPLEREALSYWLVNKPRGVITTVRDPQGRPTVVELVPARTPRLFPVGRLDRDTEGLVLLTNDGALAHVLLHPSHESEREYRVTVKGSVAPATLRRLARGVLLDEGRTAPAQVGPARFDPRARTTCFALTMIEGKKRQIRHSLRALGHSVVGLSRVRMGPLRLGRLEPGAARPLTSREIRALLRLRDEQAGRASSALRKSRGKSP